MPYEQASVRAAAARRGPREPRAFFDGISDSGVCVQWTMHPDGETMMRSGCSLGLLACASFAL
jgi:hypothetical protein